ncbi:hypothetical protein FQ142_07190 [Microbacterium sp. ANT_H45B]|nr:hypothetical protein FQ142_07190 [Microbacterium sp. ANT_H45B]
MNPLVPTFIDGVLMSALAVGFALGIFAFVSLVLTKGLSTIQVILWILAIFAVPFLGSGAWFVVRARLYSKSLPRRVVAVDQ